MNAKKMNFKMGFMVMTCLLFLSFGLPWFTFDADVMGYYCGTSVADALVLPGILLLLYCAKKVPDRYFTAGAELGSISILVLLVYSFLKWTEDANITSEINLAVSFYTALPGFWITCILAVLSFALLQLEVFSQA